MQDNSYSKYLTENDNFFYDEKSSKGSSFLKQDTELFDEETAATPAQMVRVKRVDSDKDEWQVFVDDKKHLLIRGSRFSAKEREYLRSPEGLMFIINGVKSGWKSVSEFKRQIKI